MEGKLTGAEIQKIFADVAKLLNLEVIQNETTKGDWTAATLKNDIALIYLTALRYHQKPDAMSASISLDVKHPRSRHLRDYVHYKDQGSVVWEINISLNKTPERIAKDIERRLLKPNASIVQVAKDVIAKHADRVSERNRLITKLIKQYPHTLGTSHNYKENDDYAGLYMNGFSELKTYDGTSFSFSHGSLDAEEMAYILARREAKEREARREAKEKEAA